MGRRQGSVPVVNSVPKRILPVGDALPGLFPTSGLVAESPIG